MPLGPLVYEARKHCYRGAEDITEYSLHDANLITVDSLHNVALLWRRTACLAKTRAKPFLKILKLFRHVPLTSLNWFELKNQKLGLEKAKNKFLKVFGS